MATAVAEKTDYRVKQPKGLSDRIRWLRDYYFEGVKRPWNNQFTAWSTGTDWDIQFRPRRTGNPFDNRPIIPKNYPHLFGAPEDLQ